MGHREEKVYEVLDPLCRYGWQDVINAVGEDMIEGGDGFLEVVWDEGRTQIQGLNHLDATGVHVMLERLDDSEQIHYQVIAEGALRNAVVMAAWGDLESLKTRYQGGDSVEIGQEARTLAVIEGSIVNSEVIHFRVPTARDAYYGYPDWVSATPAIELVQCMTRHEFDFYFNRGVPEFIYHLIGQSVNKESWEKIEKVIKGSQGIGNSRKTAAIHIPTAPGNVTVQVDKLGIEGQQDNSNEKGIAQAMVIATAHGVPPILANILLPGKIGAANEGPNALMLFQKRKLGQLQRLVSRLLSVTLASKGTKFLDGGSLTPDLFLGKGVKSPDENGQPLYLERGNGFATVLDGMTLGAQDTMARMKEPLTGSGRNPEDGLLEGADDRKPADPRRTR